METRTTITALDSLKKIDRLWFDDADVVFCAGKSKFKVYPGMLSAQSAIFKDTFSLPQPGSGGATNGDVNNMCTVITLPDDEQDVYYFFLAIFDPSFYSPLPSRYPLSVHVSILKLAHKYEVPFLKHRAVLHLESFFPMDMAQAVTSIRIQRLSNTPRPDIDTPSMNEYMDILPVLDQAGLQWVIPTVLYILISLYDIGRIIESPSFRLLPSKYQIPIVHSEINYAMEEQTTNSWMGKLPSTGCTTQHICRQISKTIHEKDDELPIRKTYLFLLVQTRVPIVGEMREYCSKCQAAGDKYMVEHRQRFMKQYWIFCGFTNREGAEEMRRKAIADLEKGIAGFGDLKFIQ